MKATLDGFSIESTLLRQQSLNAEIHQLWHIKTDTKLLNWAK